MLSLRERSWSLQKAFAPSRSVKPRERLLQLRLAANRPLARVRVPHGSLQVDLRDRGVGRNIYRDCAYEPAETLALTRLTPSGGIVLDVGANLGYYTTLFARRAARVFAVEPHPSTVALLRANTAHMANVCILPVLVGDRDREGALYLSPEGNAGDHQAIPRADRRSIPVPMKTLDSIAAQHDIRRVDLLKLDIQGYEVFALRGATKLLADNPQAQIVAEFWPLGLRDAGLTVADWVDAFGSCATFARIGETGEALPISRDWFADQPLTHYESLIVTRH